MSKKSPKSIPESPKTETVEEEKTEILFDDKWSCDIIFLVESDVPSNNFVNIFQQIKQIQPGIKNLTKNEIMKEVKKKGGSKKGSGKSQKKGKGDAPVELTDEQKIMKAVKENIGLPSRSLANVIKKYLINLKMNDENERQKLYADFLQTSKKKVKSPKKGSKKQDKPSDEDKPEEEIYIEKPPLFIIISGFYEYDLPLELLKIDVLIRGVVKLEEPTKITINDEAQQPKTNFDDLESTKFNMAWLKFWYMYENLMAIPTNAKHENDLALITIQIPEKFNDPNVNAKDKKLIVQNKIISIVQYIQTLLEQHKNYLNSTHFYAIPDQIAPLEEASLYNTLTQMVPTECSSVPFILFCILEQVCFWNGEEINTEHKNKLDKNGNMGFTSTTPCMPVIISNNDENLLKTFHLNIPEINFRQINKNLLSTMPLLKQFKVYPKKNQMEKYFYEFHVQRLWKHVENKKIGIGLFEIYLHWYILCKIKTYCNLKFRSINCNSYSPDNLGHVLIDKWINELVVNSVIKVISDDENTFPDKPEHCRRSAGLNEEVIERNEFSDIKEDKKNNCEHKEVKKIKIARKDNLKLLRNFLYCFELLCLQENEKSQTITSYFKNYMDFQHIEEMSSESLLQLLQDSLLRFCHVENVYYPPTNKILLWFHNDLCSIFKDKFSVELNTLLGFRDFYNSIILAQEIDKEENLNRERTQSDKESIKDNHSDQLSDKLYFNLGKTKIQLDRSIKKFFSEDGSSVIVEVDDWYKTSKVLNIRVIKIDTELKIYKNIVNDVIDQESEEKITANLTLRNGIFLNIPVIEKNISPINENQNLGKRNFIYNYFTITLPTGLVIEVRKNEVDNETYVKQSYVNKGPDCNKIWDERSRYFLKSGTIILFKNDDTIDVIYGNSVKCSIKNIEPSEVEYVSNEKDKPAEPDKNLTKTVTPQSLEESKEKKSKKSSKRKQNQEEKSEAPEIIEEVKVKKSVYKILEHSVNSWSGINYEFKDGVCTNVVDSNANLRTIFSPYKELFIDRSDGVKSLLSEDGHLVSMSSDGTKLLTYFYEEENEAGFSDDKITKKLDNNANFERFDSFGYESSLHDLRDSSFNQSIQGSDLNLQEEEYMEESRFVSLKLGCVMEHPNYASVEFYAECDTIKLTLPGNLYVEVQETNDKRSFNIEITDGNKMKVSFTNDSIEFLSNVYKKSNCLNVTIIKPHIESDGVDEYSEYFCKSFGSLGYLFLVDNKGEVKLINTKMELETLPKDVYLKTSVTNLPGQESYFDNYIPKKISGRYFVLNENFSGYEIINKNDLEYIDEKDERKYENVSVIHNPTNGRIKSTMRQYLIYKTYSENFLVPYETGELHTIPDKLQRIDLGPVWTRTQSPWFLVRTEKAKHYYKHFSYSDISRHDDYRIIAVVVKTRQQITDEDEFNSLNVIADCLKKYNNENEELYKKYKNQSFSDFEIIDTRLQETHELINKIKDDFPQWNSIKTDCDVCKQKFGQLKKVDDPSDDTSANSEENGTND